jgi:ornithine carbamoyltransferase
MPLLKGRDLVETRDLTNEEISSLLDLARELKARAVRGETSALLPHVCLAALFHEPCESVRLTVETAAAQLGARAVFLTSDGLSTLGGAAPRHTAELLGAIGAAILIRHPESITAGTKRLQEIARFAESPLINMGSDADDPIASLADLMTIRESIRSRPEGPQTRPTLGRFSESRSNADAADRPPQSSFPFGIGSSRCPSRGISTSRKRHQRGPVQREE